MGLAARQCEEGWSRRPKYCFTALFNKMWTLEVNAQPTNAFFATVSQMFGGSSQLPTTAKHCFVV